MISGQTTEEESFYARRAMQLRARRPTASPLPLGEAQTDATIAAMFALADDAQRTGGVRALTDRLASVIGSTTPAALKPAIFNWVKSSRRKRLDPDGVERLDHPDSLLAQIASSNGPIAIDCKKTATLALAMMQAIGCVPALTVIRAPGSEEWAHVLAVWLYDRSSEPEPFDPQETHAPGLWPAGAIERAKVYIGGAG
ncbi:MAG: hypothetical protein K2X32_06885 [Phycisphaerales bacterium]|nr:hypothetical protein [Phycisphaerales bacterium]